MAADNELTGAIGARRPVRRRFGRTRSGLRLNRRGHRWPTWALVAVMFVALVLGMVVGYLPAGSRGNAGASSSGPSFPSGPSAGQGSVPTTTRTRGGSSSGLTTVPVATTGTAKAPGSTSLKRVGTTTPPLTSTTAAHRVTTTLPPTSTTTTLPVMKTVVLQTPQTTGPASTPQFTIPKGPYEFGYAYDCQAAPAADQSFAVSVVTAGGPAPSPAVFSRGLKGSGTRVVATEGAQTLDVETAAACQWVLKVVAP